MTAANLESKAPAASNTNDLNSSKTENINTTQTESISIPKVIGTDYSYKHKIVWKNAIGFLIMHLLAAWGVGLILTGYVKWQTILWSKCYKCIIFNNIIFFVFSVLCACNTTFFLVFCVAMLATEGVTIGAHRFYTHKSFKATTFLKVVFLVFQTLAGQNSMFIWCRDHRLHHRYSDTDADPHNSKRGFFFCHIGWLMHKKHPYVIELGRKIDMSDMQADWMVMFQKK